MDEQGEDEEGKLSAKAKKKERKARKRKTVRKKKTVKSEKGKAGAEDGQRKKEKVEEKKKIKEKKKKGQKEKSKNLSQDEAATKIQATVRGRKERAKLKEDKKKKKKKKKKKEKDVNSKELSQDEAATKIQATVRGRKERAKLQKRKKGKEEKSKKKKKKKKEEEEDEEKEEKKNEKKIKEANEEKKNEKKIKEENEKSDSKEGGEADSEPIKGNGENEGDGSKIPEESAASIENSALKEIETNIKQLERAYKKAKKKHKAKPKDPKLEKSYKKAKKKLKKAMAEKASLIETVSLEKDRQSEAIEKDEGDTAPEISKSKENTETGEAEDFQLRKAGDDAGKDANEDKDEEADIDIEIIDNDDEEEREDVDAGRILIELDPSNVDRLGFGIAGAEDGHGVVVKKIAVRGSAVHTPMKVGDKILKIDGADVAELTMPDVCRILVSKKDVFQMLLLRRDVEPAETPDEKIELPPGWHRKVEGVFSRYDADGEGEIDVYELYELMVALHTFFKCKDPRVCIHDARSMLANMKGVEGDFLSMREMKQWLSEIAMRAPEEVLEEFVAAHQRWQAEKWATEDCEFNGEDGSLVVIRRGENTIIRKVQDDSITRSRVKLREGDKLLHLNGRDVKSMEIADINTRLGEGDVRMTVLKMPDTAALKMYEFTFNFAKLVSDEALYYKITHEDGILASTAIEREDRAAALMQAHVRGFLERKRIGQLSRKASAGFNTSTRKRSSNGSAAMHDRAVQTLESEDGAPASPLARRSLVPAKNALKDVPQWVSSTIPQSFAEGYLEGFSAGWYECRKIQIGQRAKRLIAPAPPSKDIARQRALIKDQRRT
eukprot:g335.t1